MTYAAPLQYSFLVSCLHPSHVFFTELEGDYLLLLQAVVYFALVYTALTCMLEGAHAGAKITAVGVRSMMSFLVLNNYRELFVELVRVVDGVCGALRARAEYALSIEALLDNAIKYVSQSDSGVESAVGLLKGAMLSASGVLSHWSLPTAIHAVDVWTAILLNVVYLLGPLLVIAGVLEDGKYFKSWVFCLTNILLWPIFPRFVLLVSGFILTDFHIAHDNLFAASSMNAILSGVGLITPIVVGACLTYGGIAGLGAVGWGLAVRTVAHAVGGLIGQHLPLSPAPAGGGSSSGAASSGGGMSPQPRPQAPTSGGGGTFDANDPSKLFEPVIPRYPFERGYQRFWSKKPFDLAANFSLAASQTPKPKPIAKVAKTLDKET